MANHFRTDEQQESSFDGRFGVISQDDLDQLDQQDIVADEVRNRTFLLMCQWPRLLKLLTTVSDPFASWRQKLYTVFAEQQKITLSRRLLIAQSSLLILLRNTSG